MQRTRETLLGVLRGYDSMEALSTVRWDERLVEKAHGAREGKSNQLPPEKAEEMERAKGTDMSTLFKETDEDVYARVLPVIHEEIARVVSSDSPKDSLLVIHGGIIRVLLRDIFEVGGKDKIRVWNGSVSRVGVSVSKSSTSPLPDAAMDKNSIVVKGELHTWTCALAGPIGDVTYLPEDLRVKRSDV